MNQEAASQSAAMELPRPGLLGLLIRAILGVVVLASLADAILNAREYWNGFSDPIGALPLFIPLVLLSSWVINELLQKNWGWRPLWVLLAGAGIAMGVGASQGDPWGPSFGVYVWVWQLLWAGLLGPAFVLAVFLRTPGCEMRSYADLWTRLRGGDPQTVQCPGWIDRFDGIRIFGKP